MNLNLYTLTAIEGISVGHVTMSKEGTGCTVVLCPPHTVCAVAQNGGGSGTRETDSFRPGTLVECVDAIAFSGGSVFGLSVADGVLKYLCEHERGMRTAGGLVPLVPTAIIYDLLVGNMTCFPDAAMGYEACLNANALPVKSGRVGAGTGATTGKHGGIKTARPSGIGNAGTQASSEIKMAVMLVVNSFGDVIEPGRDLSQAEKSIILGPHNKARIENTVLGVVATNASLNKDELTIVARMAQSGLARAIYPCHTPFDGDTIFAISTGTKPYDVFSLGTLAQRLTQEAVYDAIISVG